MSAPIHDADAESVVISTLLLAPDLVMDLSGLVAESDFYIPENREIFRAVTILEAENVPVDLVSVATRLRELGRLEQAGGTSYLAQVADATPALANVRTHAARVARLGRQRALGELAARLSAEARLEQPEAWAELAAGTLEAALERGSSDNGLVTMRNAIRRFQELRDSGSQKGISTGMPSLDSQIGGLHIGMTVVAGRPGSGKSAFAWKLATAGAEQKIGVFVSSQEMASELLAARALSASANIDTQEINNQKLDFETWKRLAASMEKIGKLPIVIDDSGPQSLAVLRGKVKAAANALQSEYDVKLGLIVVDYLQLMGDDSGSGNRESEVARLSRGMVALSKKWQVPVVALSQLSRKCEERTDKRPIMSDLRESGAIEQDAFCILGLYRDEYYNPDSADKGIVEILILKLRQGGNSGRDATVRARWHGPTCSIHDFDEPDPSSRFIAVNAKTEWDGDFASGFA